MAYKTIWQTERKIQRWLTQRWRLSEGEVLSEHMMSIRRTICGAGALNCLSVCASMFKSDLHRIKVLGKLREGQLACLTLCPH